jgi:hypothetical protein
MTPVARLVTLVDVDDRASDAHRMSFSARHEAVLVDGRRVLLLDDRGWSWSSWPGDLLDSGDIEETARVVVGPDEPTDGRSYEEMAAGHWAHLAAVLRHEGIVVDAPDLERLPHDVVLSERLLARLASGAEGPASS